MMRIKISQKNQLFDAIERSLLSPAMFNYTVTTAPNAEVVITYQEQDFYFQFNESSQGIELTNSPGVNSLSDYEVVEDWGELINEFNGWLARVSEEAQLTDKWKDFENLVSGMTLNYDKKIVNDKFTVPEYLNVKERMETLKIGFAAIALNNSQLAIFGDKIDVLLEQTKHLGKFDWRSLFVGTIISLIMQLSLSQEQGKDLWMLVKQVFSEYFLTY